MPDHVNRAAITHMAIKILENTGQDVPWKRKVQLLSRFSLRMKQSGYNERFSMNVLQSALKNLKRRLAQDRSGERPLHRVKNWRKEEKRRGKDKKKRTWYAGKTSREGGDVYNMFPVFCPATPKGALALLWRKIATEIAEQSNDQVKHRIVEQGGVPIRAILCKKSPA